MRLNRIDYGKLVAGIEEKTNNVFRVDTGVFKTDNNLFLRKRSDFGNQLQKSGSIVVKCKWLNENNAVRIHNSYVVCGFCYINTDINHTKTSPKIKIQCTEPPENILVNLRDIKNRKQRSIQL